MDTLRVEVWVWVLEMASEIQACKLGFEWEMC